MSSTQLSLHRPTPTAASLLCRRTLRRLPVTCAAVPNRSDEIISAAAKVLAGTYKRDEVVLASGKGCKLYDFEGREYIDMTSGIAVNSLGHGDSDFTEAVKRQAGFVHVSNVFHSEPQVFSGRTYKRDEVVLASGKGCKLYDFEGGEYIDMTSGIAVNALGHGDSVFTEAVKKQAGFVHVSNVFHSEPLVELALRLVKDSFADRVFFCNSGTEATEAAIKFARKYQRFSNPNTNNPPTEFVSFSSSFHGRTMGSIALTYKEHYRAPFEPVMPGVSFTQYGDLQAAKELIKSGNIAGVFVEPLQGEGGIHCATKEFLQGLRSACDNAGALLVFDEVQCGVGRTGYLWAHESYGIFPDIMTVAKPLAGGLPIGAVLMTEKVNSAIDYGDHGSTFAGSPLVCTAAISVYDKISDPKFLASVTKKGKYLKDLLRQKLGGNSHVKEVRGMGLIVGIELDVLADPFKEECRKSGLLILTAGKGDVVRLVPPLVISEEELDKAVEILVKCLPVLDSC